MHKSMLLCLLLSALSLQAVAVDLPLTRQPSQMDSLEKQEAEKKSLYERYPDSPETSLPSIMESVRPVPRNARAPVVARDTPVPKGRKLRDLRGFWFVSGATGSLSRVSAGTTANGKQRYTMVYEQPRAYRYSLHGYRRGDIDSVGLFDIEHQIISDTPSMKASASNLKPYANPDCTIIKASTVEFALQDQGDISGSPGVRAYSVKRATPAHKICRYYVLKEGYCRVTRCTEMFTESNIDMYKVKDSLLTNNLAYAKRYSQSIEYRGPSDALLARELADARTDMEVRDVERLIKFGQKVDRAFKQGDIDRQRRQRQRVLEKQDKERQRLKRVLAELAPPDANACQPYLEKEQYENFDELALFGVKLGMGMRSAHIALVCNNFRIAPNIAVYIRSAEKYFSHARGKQYIRRMADGSDQRTTLELSPGQQKNGKQTYKIYSIKFSHEPKRISETLEWKNVRRKFLDKYDLSGRDKDDYRISYKRDRQHQLMIYATRPRPDKRYSYTIKLCCKC